MFARWTYDRIIRFFITGLVPTAIYAGGCTSRCITFVCTVHLYSSAVHAGNRRQISPQRLDACLRCLSSAPINIKPHSASEPPDQLPCSTPLPTLFPPPRYGCVHIRCKRVSMRDGIAQGMGHSLAKRWPIGPAVFYIGT